MTKQNIESKVAYAYQVALMNNKLGYREKNVWDDYESHAYTTHKNCANVYDSKGNGFLIVVEAFDSHKIGDIVG